jgi:hypothetical protein
MTTVTGRTYTATRPRGLASWSPQAHTLNLLRQVNEVLAEYADHLPLTARQIFYRLVGRYGYDKTEAAYNRLLEALNRARRAGYIPWDALRDDGTVSAEPNAWRDPDHFWAAVRGTADRYVHDLLDGQATIVEVWVEAAGMVPQIARVAHEYGITVFSAGGFNSVTEKHDAALRMVRRSREGQDTLVLHVGDHDPSGCAIVDSAAEDITAFCEDYGQPFAVEFERIAVTPTQIETFDLATAPQKRTDQRGEHMAETVQAEALAPDQMADAVRAAIEDAIDADAMLHARHLGQTERDAILEHLDGVA